MKLQTKLIACIAALGLTAGIAQGQQGTPEVAPPTVSRGFVGISAGPSLNILNTHLGLSADLLGAGYLLSQHVGLYAKASIVQSHYRGEARNRSLSLLAGPLFSIYRQGSSTAWELSPMAGVSNHSMYVYAGDLKGTRADAKALITLALHAQMRKALTRHIDLILASSLLFHPSEISYSGASIMDRSEPSSSQSLPKDITLYLKQRDHISLSLMAGVAFRL